MPLLHTGQAPLLCDMQQDVCAWVLRWWGLSDAVGWGAFGGRDTWGCSAAEWAVGLLCSSPLDQGWLQQGCHCLHIRRCCTVLTPLLHSSNNAIVDRAC